jgi:hypothetical protein
MWIEENYDGIFGSCGYGSTIVKLFCLFQVLTSTVDRYIYIYVLCVYIYINCYIFLYTSTIDYHSSSPHAFFLVSQKTGYPYDRYPHHIPGIISCHMKISCPGSDLAGAIPSDAQVPGTRIE